MLFIIINPDSAEAHFKVLSRSHKASVKFAPDAERAPLVRQLVAKLLVQLVINFVKQRDYIIRNIYKNPSPEETHAIERLLAMIQLLKGSRLGGVASLVLHHHNSLVSILPHPGSRFYEGDREMLNDILDICGQLRKSEEKTLEQISKQKAA